MIQNTSLCHMAIVGRGRCMGGECKGDMCRKDRLSVGGMLLPGVVHCVGEHGTTAHTCTQSHAQGVNCIVVTTGTIQLATIPNRVAQSFDPSGLHTPSSRSAIFMSPSTLISLTSIHAHRRGRRLINPPLPKAPKYISYNVKMQNSFHNYLSKLSSLVAMTLVRGDTTVNKAAYPI